MPVPSGITARSAAPPARTTPFADSLSVPSPPTATRSSAPSRTAASASSIRWPGRSEKSVVPSSPSCAARCASSGQRLPVAPLADAGLTRKTVLMVGRNGRERDARHPVDRRTQLFVGDPLELTLDDDVADGEETADVHLPERADREEHSRLHLDPE